MAGEISPETQAILDALDNHGSKAGVRVVRGADGSVNLIEVDKDGKPVLGADGQPTQIPLTPKKPSQFTLNEKRYQLDENGNPQEIADNSKPAVVPRGASVAHTDPGTGQTTFAQAPPAPPAPLSPQDQIKAQIEYWNAQVLAGKLAPNAAKTNLEDWIDRNVTQPTKITTAIQGVANTDMAGDVSALTANRSLLNDQIQTARINEAANRPLGWWKGDYKPDMSGINSMVGTLKALKGISPYADYVTGAAARLNLPGTNATSTGTPPPAPAPEQAPPPLPLTPDQVQALLAKNAYQPPAAAAG
jgi:hypothetical protein